jgi:hypothetical protein
MYATREFVNIGGLISYGVDFHDLFRRAAEYVDKICAERSRATSRSSSRRGSRWRSISRLRKPSASTCRTGCSRSRTRSSNDTRGPLRIIGAHEAPRGPHDPRRRGSVATHGARAAAACNPGDRFPQQSVSQRCGSHDERILPRPERCRLRQGCQCHGRASVGRRTI